MRGVDAAAKAAGTARIQRGEKRLNPCIAVYGSGPEGTTCRTCESRWLNHGHSKCKLREFSYTSRTDHNQNFPSCGKYEPKAIA